MSLVADYSDTNSSSSEDSSDDSKTVEASVTSKPLLPSASSLLVSGTKKTGEVFQNRFKLEASLEKASLEQHVKMVDNDQHLNTKNGRKICWNYRKGRCRFGSKCQYAHDSDLVGANEIKADNKESTTTIDTFTTQSSSEISRQTLKRKRPGLGDSIKPGKRVLNAYTKQHKE